MSHKKKQKTSVLNQQLIEEDVTSFSPQEFDVTDVESKRTMAGNISALSEDELLLILQEQQHQMNNISHELDGMASNNLKKTEIGFRMFTITYSFIMIIGVLITIIGISLLILRSPDIVSVSILAIGLVLILLCLSRNPIRQTLLFYETTAEVQVILTAYRSYNNQFLSFFKAKKLMSELDLDKFIELTNHKIAVSQLHIEQIRDTFERYEDFK